MSIVNDFRVVQSHRSKYTMQSDLLIYKEAKYPGNKFPASTLFCLDLCRIKPPKKRYNKKISHVSEKCIFVALVARMWDRRKFNGAI